MAYTLPLGVQLSNKLQIKAIEHKMELALEKQHTTTIQLPIQQIVWVKKGKELLLNKQLFDVKSIEIINEIAIITGLYDSDEKRINDAIALNLKQQTQHAETQWQQYLQLVWYFKKLILIEPALLLKEQKIYTSHLVKYCPTTYSLVPTPPPNFAA
jgi:hypothetical protein